jgi:hypothetical protein
MPPHIARCQTGTISRTRARIISLRLRLKRNRTERRSYIRGPKPVGLVPKESKAWNWKIRACSRGIHLLKDADPIRAGENKARNENKTRKGARTGMKEGMGGRRKTWWRASISHSSATGGDGESKEEEDRRSMEGSIDRSSIESEKTREREKWNKFGEGFWNCRRAPEIKKTIKNLKKNCSCFDIYIYLYIFIYLYIN